jgi:putative ABC transport system substrate-binding protein
MHNATLLMCYRFDPGPFGGFMRRREFVALAMGAPAVWLGAVRAEPADRMPLIGVITPLSQDDPEGQARLAAFLQALQELDASRKVRVENRWGAGDADRNRKNAAELVSLSPDVILATGSLTLEPLLRATHTVPIVFVNVADPVGAGMVESLSRPGGNATGFTTIDYDAAGKWLELLKEIAPGVKRVALLRDSTTAAGIGQWAASEAFAGTFGVELRPVGVSVAAELERSIDMIARDPNGGMIVTESGPAIVHRELIIALAARYRLPAVYPFRLFVTEGGLISYGNNTIDPYRRAAVYVDRILKGTKPSELPVQNPIKFELVINLKTAMALGLSIPPSLLARADEVIE